MCIFVKATEVSFFIAASRQDIDTNNGAHNPLLKFYFCLEKSPKDERRACA